MYRDFCNAQRDATPRDRPYATKRPMGALVETPLAHLHPRPMCFHGPRMQSAPGCACRRGLTGGIAQGIGPGGTPRTRPPLGSAFSRSAPFLIPCRMPNVTSSDPSKFGRAGPGATPKKIVFLCHGDLVYWHCQTSSGPAACMRMGQRGRQRTGPGAEGVLQQGLSRGDWPSRRADATGRGRMMEDRKRASKWCPKWKKALPMWRCLFSIGVLP